LGPRSGRPLIAFALVLLGALALASPAQAISLAPETPRSPNAEAIATTYWVMLGIAAALIVAVNGALIAAALRFRARRSRRPGRAPSGRGRLRPALAALSVLAVAVFVFGVVMTAAVRDVDESGPEGLEAALAQTAQVGISGVPPPDPFAADAPQDPAETSPLEIDAIAQRWVWRFEYPGGEAGQGLFTYGELVVPVDTTVIVNVTSTDVSHSYWVPALGGQVQATPGSTSETWFKAADEGRYAGNSTIFAGTGFPSLRSWVRVVSVSEYRSFLGDLGGELQEAQETVAEDEGEPEEAADESATSEEQTP